MFFKQNEHPLAGWFLSLWPFQIVGKVIKSYTIIILEALGMYESVGKVLDDSLTAVLTLVSGEFAINTAINIYIWW